MSFLFSPILALFKYHKLKIFGAFLFALLFALLIFPYDDLTDLATMKISQVTNNAVYLQFDSLDLALFPPGLSMGGVSVETTGLPPLKAQKLAILPWLSGLIVGKQGGSVDAVGLFGGGVAADLHEGEKGKSGERLKTVAIDAKGIKLPDVAKFLSQGGLASLLVQGNLDLSTLMQIDPVFDTQPSGDIGIKVENLALPGQTLHVSMAPGSPAMALGMPEVKLGNTKLTAKMADGFLQIQDFSFGNDSTLAGKVTGQLGVTFRRSNVGVQPLVGSYDLKVNLKLPKAFVQANEKAGLSLAFAMLPPAARKETAKGTELAFRIQPPPPGQGVPQITAIQ